ncbi:probable asparagine--tRNA ligase, mitochondrial [Octopus sinensis]|uniref:asparagine--tRNA ligase n=1 Tax=Octopus sinensis TaxID=2607531 RepID=A0A6P7S8S0_9MOLL|nr:probable asparagine--tRNA ligase, mitochondrial [Octopus sinensis]
MTSWSVLRGFLHPHRLKNLSSRKPNYLFTWNSLSRRVFSTHRSSIQEILQNTASNQNSPNVTLTGWIRSLRKHKNFVFLQLSDGSISNHIQVVCNAHVYDDCEAKYGSSVLVEGKLISSPSSNHAVEVEAGKIHVLGDCDPHLYPFKARRKHTLDYVRDYLHLRPRTNYFSAVLRMRNALSMAVHDYFQNNGYCFIHTPILTPSDCEGAGEVFLVDSVASNNQSKLETVKNKNFFNQNTYLTVSGQLHLEAICGSFRRCYSFGPTYRAEKSTGKLHLAEFYMVEAEIAFLDNGLDGLMTILQSLIKSTFKQLQDKHITDMNFFFNQMPEKYREMLENMKDLDFQKISYTDAINLLMKYNEKFIFPIRWGDDLKKEHEKFLVSYLENTPVFVFDFPLEIKPFYARVNDDGQTVAAVDLLVPEIGELIGGSMREERLPILEKRLKELSLDKQYSWYLDLRRFGNTKHGGFGLGFERYMQYLFNISSIKDTIPFPRYYGSCKV